MIKSELQAKKMAALLAERDKLRAEVKKLTEEKRAMAKMIAAECADPNGTIWDHAKKLQEEAELLRTAICTWAVEHQFGHPDWKEHPSNKALFDIASQHMGKEDEK